jgi:hypothetical protein
MNRFALIGGAVAVIAGVSVVFMSRKPEPAAEVVATAPQSHASSLRKRTGPDAEKSRGRNTAQERGSSESGT